MARVLLVTSGKGGVGKSTAVANLAAALGEQGRRVALVDADCGMRNLDALLGLENHVVYDLLDVAEKTCTLRQVLITDPQRPNVQLLAAPRTRGCGEITPGQMQELICDLAAMTEYVLIDCPAGVEQGFENAAAAADMALVVVTGDVTSVRDAHRAIELLQKRQMTCALLINRWHKRLARNGSIMPPDTVAELLDCPVWGQIPEDAAVVRAGNHGAPLPRRSAARTAYTAAARRIAQEPVLTQEGR
ncbi:MAG: septum site-determining protein MinD [Eubacteriales bacterium]|nr:septum site-determining protein MinD [Eubacteriales bacterium]